MSFERIGPFDLARADAVWGSLAIGFAVGSTKTRVRSASLLGLGLIIAITTGVSGDWMICGLAIFCCLTIFVIQPALRSLKSSRQICLSYDPDGIVVETSSVRTLYKWSTMGSATCAGSRLYVMINDSWGLVIPERATTSANIKALIATIDRHRPIDAPDRQAATQ